MTLFEAIAAFPGSFFIHVILTGGPVGLASISQFLDIFLSMGAASLVVASFVTPTTPYSSIVTHLATS